MSAVKQVKVDNWGVYFLQRLKHFFNRTDYCDLTLQFQDNAQLKVHRLVLNACTEYFELLERTCEMYEDCLVMPDDLQADVVVPIVNFMYTGQLEFTMDILDRLYQTSEIMSMSVLSKLLDSHRSKAKIPQSYLPLPATAKRLPRAVEVATEIIKSATPTEIITTTKTVPNKRTYTKAFEKPIVYRDKKVYIPINKQTGMSKGHSVYSEPVLPLDTRYNKKVVLGEPRPTRYELPEELDSENIFENSFCNISYTSQPLMVHPETTKQYAKRPRIMGEASCSKQIGLSAVDIVECKRMKKAQEDALFEEPAMVSDETEFFFQTQDRLDKVKRESAKDCSLLFDQILEPNEESKITIETKNSKGSSNLDHAKIISEVLKKYPHLVKSNKNIKLKILNSSKNIKKQKASPVQTFEKIPKVEKDCDYTFETDVIDSKQAAKLIALGAENIDGPWICLICGTPGKSMNFTSYYKFRRHLVEVHHEKPVLSICEHCGHKSFKRNYLLHHMYTKHGVEPPPQYRFPKCNHCNYVALSDALLSKHKASHIEHKNFRCNVCPSAFNSSNQLLLHIQNTGHKYSAERKSNLQCIYCQKLFMREVNLCAHLKSNHKTEAINDGIIDDSEDESDSVSVKNSNIKAEPNANDYEELDIQYQIQQRPDGNIHVVTKKTTEPLTTKKQKILNTGLTGQISPEKNKISGVSNTEPKYVQEINNTNTNEINEEIVIIDNNEYILRDNQLIPKHISEEFILSDQNVSLTVPSSMEFTNLHPNNHENIQANVVLKDSADLPQAIPIYVSDEEQYKAIMASNQSIIVDKGDPNKMLTVLTAPHTSNLETTSIELDNTQSSDMMIIQDDYPLVSKAVATDNSNIVVVYRHQMGDQNKQYQLLTTQGLEAQFVQSSAILTQNYETITTTTPGTNTPSVENQVIWHNNVQEMVDNSEIEITPVTEMQTIIGTNQVQIISTQESETSIDDLPNVELSSNVPDTSAVVANITTGNESEHIVAEEMPNTNNIKLNEDDHLVSNEQDVSQMEIEEGVSIEEHLVEEGVDISETMEPVEKVPEQTVSGNNNITTIKQTESDNIEQEESVSEILSETLLVQPQEINISSHNSEETQVVENNSDTIGISNSVDQELVAEDITEKSQFLASELTEQIDNLPETPVNEIGVIVTPNNALATDKEMSEKLEESIENIQEEVNKHMTQATLSLNCEKETNIESTADNEPVDNTTVSSQEESDHEQENDIPETTEKADPVIVQEKISSLLNDWDDSQEDNNSVTENTTSEPIEDNENIPENKAEVVSLDNENDKQDKIKSLVSDWDEDEDEKKD